MRTDPARSRARKARRVERVAENADISALTGITPVTAGLDGSKSPQDDPQRHWGTRDRTYPINQPKSRKSKPRRKKSPSRKSLVRKADTAFSLHIRKLYPVSFFSGKPTECCFHIITRSKHSVRWSLDNAVGSTMGENYEMEFNPHKYITMLIRKRGLPWYESLVRRSNETGKFGRHELAGIAERGHDGTPRTFLVEGEKDGWVLGVDRGEV